MKIRATKNYCLELGNVELMASTIASLHQGILGPNTAKETEFLKSRNSIFPPSSTSKWGICILQDTLQ